MLVRPYRPTGAVVHSAARPNRTSFVTSPTFLRRTWQAAAMGATMATEQQVTLKMTRPEALALLNAAETGLRVIEALNLVKNVGLTEETVRKLRGAAR